MTVGELLQNFKRSLWEMWSAILTAEISSVAMVLVLFAAVFVLILVIGLFVVSLDRRANAIRTMKFFRVKTGKGLQDGIYLAVGVKRSVRAGNLVAGEYITQDGSRLPPREFLLPQVLPMSEEQAHRYLREWTAAPEER